MKKEHRTHDKGFTLVELLVALAISGILLTVVYTFYTAQLRSQMAQEAALELQQGVRGAFLIMSRDIRTAGADPLETAGAGILTAEDAEFRFTRDIVGDSDTGQYDGALDEDIEDIRYAMTPNGALGREIGGAEDDSQLMPVLDNVDALDFVYLVKGDERFDPGEHSVNSIRKVEVTIVAHYGRSDRTLLRKYVDSNIYYNQRDEMILDAPNDTRRRLSMTTTIALRNN